MEISKTVLTKTLCCDRCFSQETKSMEVNGEFETPSFPNWIKCTYGALQWEHRDPLKTGFKTALLCPNCTTTLSIWMSNANNN